MSGSRLFILASLTAVASQAAATDLESKDTGPALEVHAFVSQGALKSVDNNYLVKSTAGSFELTEVGINFTSTLTDRLRVGLQLFGGGFGNRRFTAKMDWFYLDYRWRDWFGLRAGRVKLPFGLYNEVNDVDSARLPILLPGSVYPAQNRDFLLAQTGGELYGYLRVGAAGAIDYRIYGGTIGIDLDTQTSNTLLFQNLRVPYVVGGRVLWETPLEGLRVGGSVQRLRLDIDAVTPAGSASLRVPALLWVGSADFTRSNLLLVAEYGRWHTSLESNNQALFPDQETVSERYYALAAYRFTRWLQIGSYYAGYYRDVDLRHGRQNMLHDVAGTVRFDINPHWLVKLEGHYMRGTAGLSTPLNDNKMLTDLALDWALFLLKTTAYF
jgi:hypothetical protein